MKTQSFVLLSITATIALMSGCGTNPSAGSDGNIDIGDIDAKTAGFVMEINDELISLNMSPAYQEYVKEELDQDFTDMMLRSLEVERTDEMDSIDRKGNPFDPDEIGEGERLRFDFDMAEYDEIEGPIELDYIIVDPLSNDEMIAQYTPHEPGVYIGIVYDEGDGIEALDEEAYHHLLQYEDVLDFQYIPHIEEASGTDYASVLDVEEFPAFVILDEDGVVLSTSSIEDIEAYFE